jgi:succinate dehydrogenase / fumarate reductase flavoprotein subunit
MSESLRNDGRVWVPKTKEDAEAIRNGTKTAKDIAPEDRDYYLETKYPSFGNLVPRDVASRNAKTVCDDGRGVNVTGRAVFLDFETAIQRDGEDAIRDRYGNLFHMYEKITGDNPYKVPMKIYPATHYTMGGLWVDYSLMTTIPGLFALGEANFSDHGANRLGASALMQGLADGYFVIPHTLGNYLATDKPVSIDESHPQFQAVQDEVQDDIDTFLETHKKGSTTVIDVYRRLGHIMYDRVGMARTGEGLKSALADIRKLKDEFENEVMVPQDTDFNKYLEISFRARDFLEIAELMAIDALHREESAGGHFREEHQTEEGEARRNDDDFAYAAAWEWKGAGEEHELHKEQLVFENVKLVQRSYK